MTGNPNLRLSRDKKGGLLIQQVGPDSIGEYRCTVTADGREESASAFLRIIGERLLHSFFHVCFIKQVVVIGRFSAVSA